MKSIVICMYHVVALASTLKTNHAVSIGTTRRGGIKMSNREKRIETQFVHMYLALARGSMGEKPDCIRSISYAGRPNELDILKAKLGVIGGNWRIHRTVNARDVNKAMKWLIKDLIDHPEHASYIDSQWRTALLQPECIYGEKRFMFDVDTQDDEQLSVILKCIIESDFISATKTPKGWHYITKPFDTRKICALPNITLLRDGYVFVCEVTDPYSTKNYRSLIEQDAIDDVEIP